MSFVHLHNHTDHSPLDGLTRATDLAWAAKRMGQKAVAITDHGSINGWFKLHQEAQKAGIIPVYGEEMYLALTDRFTRDAIYLDQEDETAGEEGAQKRKTYHHLTVLARTRTGFTNLIRLHNAAEDSYWYHPRIDYPLLKQYGEGLIVLTGCVGGPVAGALSRGDEVEARRHLEAIIDAVGKENTYVEVMDHGIGAERRALEALVALAGEYDLPLVATNDCHYTHEGDAPAHDAWLAVQTSDTVNDPGRAFKFSGSGYHLKTENEMRSTRTEDWWQEACDNTQKLADSIGEDHLHHLEDALPKFPLPKGVTSAEQYLKDLVRAGAQEKYGVDQMGRLPAEVNRRLNYEFQVVAGAKVADYFLILWDLISWARSSRGLPTTEHPHGGEGEKKPIRVGMGRGSAAGSALSYCLGIAGVEPISNGLLFERFLNPTRVGMPDIDTDFEQGRHKEVFAYLRARYGPQKVARIGSFGMNKSKSALLDAGRVLGQSGAGRKLADAIPLVGATPAPIKTALNEDFEAGHVLRSLIESDKDLYGPIVQIAQGLENICRSVSIHPCATLVASTDLSGLVPLRFERDKTGKPIEGAPQVVGWDGKDVEAYGLLKLDVLGLKTLDVVSLAKEYAEELSGKEVELPTPGPHEVAKDPSLVRAFDMLSKGQTAGVFQFSSRGMAELCQELRPTNAEDLTALGALYRPGPMSANMHHHFADRKNGREKVSYDYLTTDKVEQSVLEAILAPTYATITYQEQLMQLGEAVGGLDAGMTNKLRKAFSKKDAALMEEVHQAFSRGALEGNNPTGTRFQPSTVQALWKTFEGSSQYLFNKSHSAAYGMLALHTAYLKANFPAAFAAATLASEKKDDKRRDTILSLQDEQVTVFAPDINHSKALSAPYNGGVIIGLGEVKGVGKVAGLIVAERDRGGPFTSVANLVSRMKAVEGAKLTSAHVTALICAGAFDKFGPRLGTHMGARAGANNHVFKAEWAPFEKDRRQRELLGFTTGTHPLRSQQDKVEGALKLIDFKATTSVMAAKRAVDGHRLHVVGILTRWDVKDGKNGRYALLSLEGSTRDEISGIMWESAIAKMGETPDVGMPVCVLGTLRVRNIEVETLGEDGESKTVSVQTTEIVAHRVTPLELQEQPQLALTTLDIPTSVRRAQPGEVEGAPEGEGWWFHASDGQATLVEGKENRRLLSKILARHLPKDQWVRL